MSETYKIKPGLLSGLRRTHDLTETEMAEKLDCSRSMLHRIEREGQTPSLNFIYKLVATFENEVTFYDAVVPADELTKPSESMAG